MENQKEVLDEAPHEWLSLSLGGNLASPVENSNSSRPTSTNVYSCDYCMKFFSNPQGLGGHQNAHKWEKSIIERYKLRMAIMMFMPKNTTLIRSLDDSLVHKPSKDGLPVSTSLSEASTSFGTASFPIILDEKTDMMWKGSIHLGQKPQQLLEQASDTQLDLTLKLPSDTQLDSTLKLPSDKQLDLTLKL